ncbi:MAG: hypothetical protein Ct9H300mP27_02140 [Chloroflexota bacterium]|nr:MAG: hypothetical protein Ct9H300mP27_02140 [Chloroflexota bacterium]
MILVQVMRWRWQCGNQAPIYATEEVMEKAAILMDKDGKPIPPDPETTGEETQVKEEGPQGYVGLCGLYKRSGFRGFWAPAIERELIGEIVLYN